MGGVDLVCTMETCVGSLPGRGSSVHPLSPHIVQATLAFAVSPNRAPVRSHEPPRGHAIGSQGAGGC